MILGSNPSTLTSEILTGINLRFSPVGSSAKTASYSGCIKLDSIK